MYARAFYRNYCLFHFFGAEFITCTFLGALCMYTVEAIISPSAAHTYAHS